MTTRTRTLDTTELEERVKRMYQEVALEPEHEFHFETGRPLAERLGYPTGDLDRIPAAAIESFAGVGYFLDLAAIAPGQAVLDLGRYRFVSERAANATQKYGVTSISLLGRRT
jgi:arsenite methyltransferase